MSSGDFGCLPLEMEWIANNQLLDEASHDFASIKGMTDVLMIITILIPITTTWSDFHENF